MTKLQLLVYISFIVALCYADTDSSFTAYLLRHDRVELLEAKELLMISVSLQGIIVFALLKR